MADGGELLGAGVRQRLLVARLTLERLPGAERLAQEQLDAAAGLVEALKLDASPPAPDVPPSRTQRLARTAELERALREEVARRSPRASTAWQAVLRRYGWAGLLALSLDIHVGLSVKKRSFRPTDWCGGGCRRMTR